MDSSDKQEPIAIIGAACRFAGEATSLDSLWDMLSKVKTGHCPVPGDRWDSEAWYHPDPDRKGGFPEQHGYFLQQDFSHVDAPFFSITAKEAAAMDPAKRLLLEVSYESIENGRLYAFCIEKRRELDTDHDRLQPAFMSRT
jgi:acyl transferase domain-containing protein